jgi:RNA polymerase sigma-70 factor, ECF subfamily
LPSACTGRDRKRQLAHDARVNAPAQLPKAIDRAQRSRLERMVAGDYRLIWRLLRRLGLPPAAADDGAQQVFLIAAERLADIQPGRERAFAYGTALRVAQTARRKLQRETPGLDVHDRTLQARGPDPEQQLTQQRTRDLLDRTLARLPLELRAVFVLFELEGLTSPEIAALSELPLGTVASRIRRAREQFRELVRAEGESP